MVTALRCYKTSAQGGMWPRPINVCSRLDKQINSLNNILFYHRTNSEFLFRYDSTNEDGSHEAMWGRYKSPPNPCKNSHVHVSSSMESLLSCLRLLNWLWGSEQFSLLTCTSLHDMGLCTEKARDARFRHLIHAILSVCSSAGVI